jgi:hypothetical protein
MTASQLIDSVNLWPLRRDFFFILLALACFAISPRAQAVIPPPDGGYPGFTTAEGTNALKNLTTGVGNTATGWHSLFANTAGNLNTGVGAGTLLFNAGDNNTATGALALLNNTSGLSNTAYGPCCRRLRCPVTFHYKPELDKTGIPQFGLVAEEVAAVNPDLVTHDAKGQLSTVRYEAVNAMLLNEFLKEHRKVQKLETNDAEQQREIKALVATVKEQAAQIQKVSAQFELNRLTLRTVLNNR